MDIPNDLHGVQEGIEKKIGAYQEFINTLPAYFLNLSIRALFALVLFLVGMQVIRIIRRIVKTSLRKTQTDVGVIQFLDSLIKFVLYVVLFFLVASQFGLDATGAAALVGSMGLAIGFAMQGTLANFAGGVLLLILHPFRVGDYIIEHNKNNEGTVSEIHIFYTKLTTGDEKVIILPNGTLANTSLTNVTAIDKRRLELEIPLSYQADLQKAKSIMEEIIHQDVRVLPKEEILVYVSELTENAVRMGLRCYFKNSDFLKAKWALLEEIKLRFDAQGIAFADAKRLL